MECGIQKWHLHQIPHAIPNWRCCICRICLLTLEFWMNSGRNAARIANVTFVFHFNLRYSFLFVIVFFSFCFPLFFFCLFCICRLSFIFFSLFFPLSLLSYYLYFCVFFWGGSANKFWLLAQLSYRWRHGQQQLKMSVWVCVCSLKDSDSRGRIS